MKTSEKDFLPEVLISECGKLLAGPAAILAAWRGKVKVADKL